MWAPYAARVITMQDTLSRVGAADAVCSTLQSSVDEMLHEAILVGAALTLGGHGGSQANFLARMRGQVDSFRIWRALHAQIVGILARLKKQRKRFVDAETAGTVVLARATLEREMFARCVKQARHMLRFLQLLCEGHNADMQGLMAGQLDAPESFDMVTIVCQLISSICAEPEVLTIALLNQALAFVIEAMQVCCSLRRILCGLPLL